MKKNLAVDVPRDAETEVNRIRGLKKSIFTRTRIACLCLVMVLALSVSSTLAFEKWSGNATPNAGWMSYVKLRIGESSTGDVVFDKDGTYGGGYGGKNVEIYAGTSEATLPMTVWVSLVPELESKQYKNTDDDTITGGLASMAQDWSNIHTDTSTGHQYIETAAVKVWLADGWSDKWSFGGGIFKYNEVLKKGEQTGLLVAGVELQDTVNRSDYQSIKLKVIAKGVEYVEPKDDEEETS